MAISKIEVATAQGVGDYSVSQPAGAQLDDVTFVIAGAGESGISPGPTLGTGGNVTQLDQFYDPQQDNRGIAFGWDLLPASPPASYPVQASRSIANGAALAVLFRGVDTGTPMDVTYVRASHLVSGLNNADAPQSPAISGLSAGAVVLSIIVITTGLTVAPTQPTGYELAAWSQVAGDGNGTVAVAFKTVAGGGTETPGAWSTGGASSDESIAVTVALRPAAGGPVQGSGSIPVATAAAGTGRKNATGTGTVAASTAAAGTGAKVGQGAGTVAASVAVAGAGAPVGGPVQGSGSITATVTVNGAGNKVADGSGSVAVSVPVAGDGRKVETGAGGISVAVFLNGSGTAGLGGAGQIDVAADTAAQGVKVGQGAGTVAATVSVAGQGAKVGQGAGSVTVSVAVAGAGAAGAAQGSGSIIAAVDVAAQGVKVGQGAGTVAVTVTVAGQGVKVEQGAGSVAVAVAVAGAGVFVVPTAAGVIDVSVAVTGQGIKTFSSGSGAIDVQARPWAERRFPYLNGDPRLTLRVELAIGDGALWDSADWDLDDWLEDLAWVDVSRWVVTVKTRSSARVALNEAFRAGTCTLRLQNTAGEWSLPGQGPGQVDIQPGVRLRVAIAGETVWTGYVTQLAESYGLRGESVVDVAAQDGLARLAAAELLPGQYWPQGADPKGALRSVLDAAGWPSGSAWREIDSATTLHTLERYDPNGESALDVAKRIADAEGGTVYVDRDGRVTLKGRNWLNQTKGDPPVITITADDLGDLDLREVAPLERSDARVINEASYRRQSGEGDWRHAYDLASKTIYGRRAIERSDLICEADFQCQTLANRLVANRANVRAELRSVRMRPQDTTRALALLGAGIGDVVRVDYTHPVNGWTWQQAANLVGVNHDIAKAGVWTATAALDSTYQEA